MTSPRRGVALPALLLAALAVTGCDAAPAPTAPPGSAPATTAPSPAPTELPFSRGAWPAVGSACGEGDDDAPGLARIARIEALSERVVRFTLCAPDGAFRARVAHPALAIVDASTIARIAADPSLLASVAGAGAYRAAGWGTGSAVLERTGDEGIATIVLRWDPEPASRARALRDLAVDGIDAPSDEDAREMATEPELATLVRTDAATTILGLGASRAFAPVRVRRAIAAGLDRGAIARALGPGSSVASHLAPCDAIGGCAGRPWWEFDPAAAIDALAEAGFDTARRYTLHVPDAPVPGLPDPAAAAAAVADALATRLGIAVEIVELPPGILAARLAAGEIEEFHLGGIASPLGDAAGFLERAAATETDATAAGRAGALAPEIATLAGTVGTANRVVVAERANDALRSAVPVIPLVHPGTVVAWRADVAGIATGPFGDDALGGLAPGDRRQVAFLGRAAPSGAWCGHRDDVDALRMCALAGLGLYAHLRGGEGLRAGVALRCDADAAALVWTCRIRPGLRFHDGMRVDAGDVAATFVALWDAASPLRSALPAERFGAWSALFGTPVPLALLPRPTPTPAPTPVATPAPLPSGSSAPSPSAGG